MTRLPDTLGSDSQLSHLDASGLESTRRLFWHNVVRETLNSLAVLQQTQPQLFDGRFAVLTHQQERIPIASVTPVFACSVPGNSWEHDASIAVQCTVFRVATPQGEVFTLPVHEIRAIHEISPELIQRLEDAARARSEARKRRAPQQQSPGQAIDDRPPFGFAAFTALPKPPPGPPPMHPME